MRWWAAFILLLNIFFGHCGWAATPDISSEKKNQEQFRIIRSHYAQLLKRNFSRLDSLLEQNKIIGIEYIFAGPSHMRVEAMFGHALLRFIDQDGDPYNDLVVAFVADVDEPKVSATKGIFGQYPMVIDILTFGQFSIMYMESEGRYLERYPLSLTDEQIQLAGRKLIAMGQKQDVAETNKKSMYYSFFNKNCARTMALFLEELVGRSPRNLMPPLAPGLLPRYLNFMMIQSAPGIRIRATYSVLEEMARELKVPVKQLLRDQWPELPRDFFNSWPAHEVARLFIELGPKSAKAQLKEYILQAQAQRKNLFLDFLALPEVIYQSCGNINCTQQKAELYTRLWQKESLRTAQVKMTQAIYYEGRRSSPVKNNYDTENEFVDLRNELVHRLR